VAGPEFNTASRRAHLIPLLMNTNLLVASVLISFVGLAPTAGADWPQYRGPAASGVETASELPTSWNVETGENVRWRTPIPGLAHSSPIVAGDRIFVATAVSPK
jgi:outer membrane protein assembly factor BamB